MSLQPHNFDVVLFNTHSSDREAKTKERYEAMEYVLKDVCEKTTDDLFVLCQDNVILKKHKLIINKLNADSRVIPHNKEASAYYKNSGNDGTENFTVSYPNTSGLTRLNDAMRLNPNSNFSIHRLMPVILTLNSEKNYKLLLVSWHGHYKKTKDDKQADFDRLVTILDSFKEQTGCTVVIVGGDFNMSADQAKKSNALTERNGIVLDDFKQTKDRINKIDYVVCWPEQEHYTIRCHATCREYKREEGKRPFDHNIIIYSFLYVEPVGLENRTPHKSQQNLKENETGHNLVCKATQQNSPVDALPTCSTKKTSMEESDIKQTSNQSPEDRLELELELLSNSGVHKILFHTKTARIDKETVAKTLQEKLKSEKLLPEEEFLTKNEVQFVVSGLLQNFQFHDDDAEEDAPLEKKSKFSKKLGCMMYGFGDDQNPDTRSVDLLKDIVIKYITDMTKMALEVGRPGHISVEDIIFLIRKDPKKYSRVKELLLVNEEIK